MLNNHPPTTAPTIPRMMSRNIPSPRLLTILLPMKPAIDPKTIHARNDMCSPLFRFLLKVSTSRPLRQVRHDRGERCCPERLYQFRVLSIELARLINDGRVLILRVFRQLLNRFRRDLLGLFGCNLAAMQYSGKAAERSGCQQAWPRRANQLVENTRSLLCVRIAEKRR